jgi:hypothetical protein
VAFSRTLSFPAVAEIFCFLVVISDWLDCVEKIPIPKLPKGEIEAFVPFAKMALCSVSDSYQKISKTTFV